MANHLFLPIIVPLMGAALATMFGRQRMIARVIVSAASLFNLGYSIWLMGLVSTVGRQVTQAGSWAAPFGISLVADGLGAVMLFLAALLMVTTLIYSFATISKDYENFFYYPLLLLLLVGVSGAFITGDLFNLYVWFEVLLVASFGLLVLGGTRGQLEGGLKYVVLNLFGSTCFLIGAALLYGITGTLNMAHLSERLITIENPSIVTAVACLFLFSYGSKAALVPIFFWLPTSYHTPPVAVSALYSGLLTKVGVYSLYRVFGLIFQNELYRLGNLILILAGLTMVIGVIGAVAQVEVRRILSFHIISQVGYMIMGLGLVGVAGLAAGIFYMIHHIVVKTALFLIGGAAEFIGDTGELKHLGGFAKHEPLLATLWVLASFSLAGMPPLSGFFGKLALMQVAVDQQQYGIVAVAAAVSLLTLFSMLKIWNEVFWKKPNRDISALPHASAGVLAPGLILVVVSVAVGLGAAFAVDYGAMAAEQAMDVAGYVADVCGASGCDAALTAALK